MKKFKFKKIMSTVIISLIALFVLVIQIYPLLWIFTSSFKTSAEFQTGNPFQFPSGLDLTNYIRAFQTADLATYFKNSFIVTLWGCIGVSVLSSAAAFAFAKMRLKISKPLLSFFLLGIMIPVQVTLIPMFIIYNAIGMLDSYAALALTQIGFGLPIAIYLFKEFYSYVPNDLIDSAVIDGCGMGRVYFSIVAPMSKNTFITVITMNAIFIWNEYVLANTFITKDAMKTIPIGLYAYQGEYGNTDWGATFSAISITILPVLILYFILNKSVIAGMSTGAVKG